MEKTKTNKPNYFICFPLWDNRNFIENFSKFISLLKDNYDNELFQLSTKLHMSLCVLYIKNEQQLESVKSVLDKVSKFFSEKITLQFEKYATFGPPKKCRVIYAKMKESEAVNNIIHELIKELIEAGIISKNDLESYKINVDYNGMYSVTQHITLLNQKFKSGVKNFNATQILEEIKDFDLQSCKVGEICLCSTGANEVTKRYTIFKKLAI